MLCHCTQITQRISFEDPERKEASLAHLTYYAHQSLSVIGNNQAPVFFNHLLVKYMQRIVRSGFLILGYAKRKHMFCLGNLVFTKINQIKGMHDKASN